MQTLRERARIGLYTDVSAHALVCAQMGQQGFVVEGQKRKKRVLASGSCCCCGTARSSKPMCSAWTEMLSLGLETLAASWGLREQRGAAFAVF